MSSCCKRERKHACADVSRTEFLWWRKDILRWSWLLSLQIGRQIHGLGTETWGVLLWFWVKRSKSKHVLRGEIELVLGKHRRLVLYMMVWRLWLQMWGEIQTNAADSFKLRCVFCRWERQWSWDWLKGIDYNAELWIPSQYVMPNRVMTFLKTIKENK